MRTTEIKVGTDYAHASYDHGRRSKVHVLETGVPRKEGWRHNKRAVRNGIRVRYENGHEGIVASREIREEWAPYAERQAAIAKARAEAKDEERRVQAERARQARVLDDYLAGHGVEVTTVRFYDYYGVRGALEVAGFETITTDGSEVAVKTRIKSIKDFVKDGTVEVGDLGPVLADLAITATPMGA